jgi:imidazoleglycerol-phosphate dehydratase
MRTAKVERKTKETEISLKINIDGKGKSNIKTKIGFLDHMLEIFTKNALFNLEIKADGDLDVDQHHLIEDLGIVLGKALKEALGDKKGINRAGYFAYPMDEALSIVALDISGRPNLKFEAEFKRKICGDLDCDLLEDFFKGLADNAKITLHILMKYGRDDHHKIESIFKAFGKALKIAVSKDKRMLKDIPSTKGSI